MSDTPEDAWLIALGSAVSDGAEVDWDQAERQATDASRKQILHQLRGLAQIVNAHRSDALNPDDGPRAQSAPSRHWRHIVLFEIIGSGAFGTVYRGWDPALDRDVAVKLSRATDGPASPLEEARHLARVRHTNVVTVYGADHEGDETGIWMEYINGHTLAEIVSDTGPLSAREATGVGVDLCRALAALHGAALLHRDIKAQNVMREVGGRIVLMDFSGAEARPADEWPSRRHAALHGARGPGSRHASISSDVYSLGALLFFLLSGRLPCEGATVADVKQAHAEGRRRRLARRTGRYSRSDRSGDRTSRRSSASDRYQTAGEFEHALIAASGSHAAIGVQEPRPRSRRTRRDRSGGRGHGLPPAR